MCDNMNHRMFRAETKVPETSKKPSEFKKEQQDLVHISMSEIEFKKYKNISRSEP